MPDRDPALVEALDELERKLPTLLQDYPDEGDFWAAWAGEADAITEGLPDAKEAYARGRIDCMLKNLGLIPGENEGEPCT